MNKTLIQASLAHRNFEAERKLDQMKAIKKLGFSNTGQLPKYIPQKVVKGKAGMYNFIRQILP